MRVTTRKLMLMLLAALLPLTAMADGRRTTSIEYWFDNDRGSLQTVTISDSLRFTANASSLNEGLHALHYRVKDSEGHYSAVQSWMFYRTGKSTTGGTTKLEYWIDNGTHRSINVSDTIVSFMLNASAEAEGLHTLHYRLTAAGSANSPVQSWMFYHTGKSTTGGTTKLEYWIDNGTHRSINVSDTIVSFMLNASAEAEGLHALHYRLTAAGSANSPVQSWMFYRVSPKPKATRLKSYCIWWNNHQDKAVEVAVPDSSATLLLYDEVLAVPSYARNDGYSTDCTARFHIMFIDDQGGHSAVESGTVSYPDIYPPVTTLKAVQTAGTEKVVLTWTTDKTNVRNYNVYYSENGEPYLLWKPAITQQTATFSGQRGTTYRFVVTACDTKGNYEAIEESRAVEIDLK